MNKNIPYRFDSLARLTVLFFGLALALDVRGASLTWDANSGTAGAQDGSGTWLTGASGWWDGAANANWTAASVPTFGAGTDGAYTVTVGGPIASGTPLMFNNSGYVLSAASAQTITFSAAWTVAVASGKTATIGTNVQLTSTSATWTLSGPGTLNISGPGSKVSTAGAVATTIGTGATIDVQNGGTLSSGSSIQVSGASGGAKLIVDGGVVSVGSAAGNMIINSSGSGSGTVTVTNGGSISTASVTSNGLRFGGTGGAAVLNLDGGTLTTGRVYENTVAVLSTNNFNGGTLRALSGTANAATFMTGLDRANVRNGGAFIDPNGQSITISQNFLHSDNPSDNVTDGGLTVVGAGGTLVLTGNNTYTGPTTITSNNVLSITAPYSALGSAVVVAGGGRLMVGAASTSSVLPPLTLNDGGGIKFDLGTYNPANAPGITNANLNVAGTNIIDLAGGSIPVTNITLLTYTNKTGTSTFILGTLPPGVAGTVVDTGSALVLQVTSPSGNIYNWSAGNGDWDFVTANWNAGGSIYSELQTALVIFPSSAVGTVNITTNVNPYSIAVTTTSAGYTFTGAGSIGKATTFSKAGTGLLTLTTSNSYPGVTTISAGGIVVTTDSALGSAAGGTTVSDGASLALSGNFNYSTPETVTMTGPGLAGNQFFSGSGTQRGALQSISGNNTWSGNIIFTPVDSNNRIGVQDGASLTLSGNITQSTAGLNLIFRAGNSAGSDITISGTNNNWTGSTSIYGGGGAALHLGANNALPKVSLLVVGIGGIGGNTIFDLNGFNQEVAGLNGDAVVGFIENDGPQASTLTLNPTPDQLYPGVIQDGVNSVAIVKNGSYTQILTGTSTYSGPTTINGGSLRVNGSLGTTPVTVNTNGTLDGTGTIGGPVTINPGGTLVTGGGSIGTLTINNNLTIAGNLSFKVNEALAPSNDFVNVSGVLSNAGTGVLSVYNIGTNALNVGDSFTLFNQPVSNGHLLTISGPAGVAFTNNLEVDGSITVVTPPPTTASYPTNISFSVNGATLSLTWPGTHLGWYAQSNSVSLLNTNDWFDVANSQNGTNLNITVDPAQSNVFYRLRHP